MGAPVTCHLSSYESSLCSIYDHNWGVGSVAYGNKSAYRVPANILQWYHTSLQASWFLNSPTAQLFRLQCVKIKNIEHIMDPHYSREEEITLFVFQVNVFSSPLS